MVALMLVLAAAQPSRQSFPKAEIDCNPRARGRENDACIAKCTRQYVKKDDKKRAKYSGCMQRCTTPITAKFNQCLSDAQRRIDEDKCLQGLRPNWDRCSKSCDEQWGTLTPENVRCINACRTSFEQLVLDNCGAQSRAKLSQ